MVHPLLTFGVGILLGVGSAVVASRIVIRRTLAKAREAQRRARSAERLAEVGAMTAGLAHEIKNPLSTIGLNAQLLAEGIEELQGVDPETRGRLTRRVGSLRREVERLRGILSDFLNFAGELRLDLKPVDLNALVEDLTDFFAAQANQLGIRMRVDAAADKIQVVGDVGHLKQAVLNLLLNATQAMASQPPESPRELIIRTSTTQDADGQSMGMIHVIDTGPGMSQEVREKMFSPYFTTKSGGTGLGLPTTRRIVEAHGGRIDLYSEQGRGSEFRLVLPLGGWGGPPSGK